MILVEKSLEKLLELYRNGQKNSDVIVRILIIEGFD
jgi:hypothetical protein